MFAYLLIAIELSILYFAYWYVFVREPKPVEIKENLWGTYDEAAMNGTEYGISAAGTSFDAGNAKPVKKIRKVVHTGHTLLRSARHGVRRKDICNTELRYGWTQIDEPKPDNSFTLLNLLADLSVKLT